MVSTLQIPAAQQFLKGHVPAATKGLSPIGRLESNRRLDLSIGLPLRNGDALTNLLQGLYDPTNPNFRHYLTPDQFASAFSPSAEDYQKVIDFAKAHGLVVKGTHPNRTLVDVSGSVGDIEKAFHVHLMV
jgi:subtilase family serine protease